jgi:hypothetical protein
MTVVNNSRKSSTHKCTTQNRQKSVVVKTVHKVEGDLLPAYRSLGFGRFSLTDGVIVTQVRQFLKEGSIEIHGPDGAAKWLCSTKGGKAWLMKEQELIEFHNDAFDQFLLRHDGTVSVRLPYS